MVVPNVVTNTPIASAWGNTVADAINALEARPLAEFASGSYTPSLTNLSIGTGGNPQNLAEYTYVGGANVGQNGLLIAMGTIELGTSGTVGNAPTLAMPTGFVLDLVSGSNNPIGAARLSDVSTGANTRQALVYPSTTGTIRFITDGFGSTVGSITATSPFTWAAGDLIAWNFAARVTRV